MKLSETDTKKQIRDCLEAVGALVVPQLQGIGSKKGVSDILVCYQGTFIAIEVKRPGWSPPARGTKAYAHYWRQRQFVESVQAAGGIGFFASSVEKVIEQLELKATLYPLFKEMFKK